MIVKVAFLSTSSSFYYYYCNIVVFILLSSYNNRIPFTVVDGFSDSTTTTATTTTTVPYPPHHIRRTTTERSDQGLLLPPYIPALNFSDINVIVLTDIHSWVGGHHRQEQTYDADLGHVLSFYERLQEYGATHHIDIFLVNNGDFVHGTGLSQMNPSNPSYLIPLLEKMPYDAITCGNHELYDDSTISTMTLPGGYIDWWGDKYVTANIMRTYPIKNPPQPLGHRYKILQGKYQNTKVLTFGFLYNMHDSDSTLIHVESVQSVVQQQWFIDVLLEEQYDAIMILAHMDLVDPLVDVIRTSIRHQIGEDDTIPIVFITGHTHYRGYKQLEDLSISFEAGRYLDTVGFVSFPKKESVLRNGGGGGGSAGGAGRMNATTTTTTTTSSLFQHTFIDASREGLFHTVLGYPSSSIDDAITTNGQALSTYIDTTRQKLGLLEEVGCAPQQYIVERSLHESDSLWRLYREEVIPKMFQHRTINPTSTPQGDKGGTENDNTDAAADTADTDIELDLPVAMILSKESWRYNIYNNATLIADDIMAVAPFNDTVVYLGRFSGTIILQAYQQLNLYLDEWMNMLPNYILIGDVDIMAIADSISNKISEATTTTTATTIPYSDYDGNTMYHLYTHEFQDTKVQKVVQDLVPANVNVMISKTEYRSTMIWIAFVKEYWSCDGKIGPVPNWFPTNPTDYFFHKNNTPTNRKHIQSIIVAVTLTSVFFAVSLCVYIITIRYCCTYQPIQQGEEDYNDDDDGVILYHDKVTTIVKEGGEGHVDNDLNAVQSSYESDEDGLRGIGYDTDKTDLEEEDDGMVLL